MERILTPPPASDGDRWRPKFSPEQIDELDPDGWGEKILTSAGNHGVGSPEVKSHLVDIGEAGAFLQVKKFLQNVKNTPSEYEKHIRDAAEALIITYKFDEADEAEETIGDKPGFRKDTPSSWEEYKKRLMWGADMDPKILKDLSPEERKKRIDKFFKSPH